MVDVVGFAGHVIEVDSGSPSGSGRSEGNPISFLQAHSILADSGKPKSVWADALESLVIDTKKAGPIGPAEIN
jgi:hypothetical protein